MQRILIFIIKIFGFDFNCLLTKLRHLFCVSQSYSFKGSVRQIILEEFCHKTLQLDGTLKII